MGRAGASNQSPLPRNGNWEIASRDRRPKPAIFLNRASGAVDDPTLDNPAAWTAPSFAAVKGIIHQPGAKQAMKPECRDALLTAIAKARGWIDDIRLGRFASFAEIAEREALCERHIRLLAPVAFLSPRIIAAIVEGTAPPGLTVTGLAKVLPYSWAEQERRTSLLSPETEIGK
jgi:hypothetical protein